MRAFSFSLIFLSVSLVSLALPVSAVAQTPGVDQIRPLDAQMIQDPFLRALAMNYRSFSLYESDLMGDLDSAELFAQKTLSVYHGTLLQPENPSNWSIPSPAQPDVQRGYADLMNFLHAGAAQKYPDLTAEAQGKFDCWVEQLEENWQWDHIEACRIRFENAMRDLRGKLYPAQPQPQPQPAPQAPVQDKPAVPYIPVYDKPSTTDEGAQHIINIYTCDSEGCTLRPATCENNTCQVTETPREESKKQEPEVIYSPKEPVPEQPKDDYPFPIEIFFDWDRTEIKSEWNTTLQGLASYLSKHPDTKLQIEGHADTSGSEGYNYVLSRRRIDSVLTYLTMHGASASQFVTIPKGESDLKVPTKDGVREPSNRRVRITR